MYAILDTADPQPSACLFERFPDEKVHPAQSGLVRTCTCVYIRHQSYLALCNPMDYSLPGSSVHGIPQERILEWAAIPFSRGSSRPRALTLQVDSLLSEPPGKPKNMYTKH